MNFGNPETKHTPCPKSKQVAINSKSICIMWQFVLGHKIKILLERRRREQALATQPPALHWWQEVLFGLDYTISPGIDSLKKKASLCQQLQRLLWQRCAWARACGQSCCLVHRAAPNNPCAPNSTLVQILTLPLDPTIKPAVHMQSGRRSTWIFIPCAYSLCLAQSSWALWPNNTACSWCIISFWIDKLWNKLWLNAHRQHSTNPWFDFLILSP